MERYISLFLVLAIMIFLSGCSKPVQPINSFEEFNKLLQRKFEGDFKESIAYDLRDDENCQNGHIKGFMCIMNEYETINDLLTDIIQIYSKRAYIFIIDANGSDSLKLAELLKEQGYKHIIYYEKGYEQYIVDYPDFVPEIGCDC